MATGESPVSGGTDFHPFVYLEGTCRGWRVDLFLDKLETGKEIEHLLCKKCGGVARNACLVKFRKRRVVRCSACIPTELKENSTPIDFVRESVNDLDVFCPLKPKGCAGKFRLKEMLEHLENNCGCCPVECPLGCVVNGRVVIMPMRLIGEHLETCRMRLITCNFCGEQEKACRMDSHNMACTEFPFPCMNKCGEQLPLNEMSTHLETECPLEPVRCPYAKFGCQKRGERSLLAEHVKNCPLRAVKCQYCENEIKLSELTSHHDVCSEYPITCTRLCTLQMLRKELDAHLATSCPLEIVKCPFAEHGCEEKTERRQMDQHARDNLTNHFKLTTISTDNLMTRQNDKIKELETQIKQNQPNILKLEMLISSWNSTGRLVWKIPNIRKKIEQRVETYSSPFNTGFYKCQAYIKWGVDFGYIGCFLCVMRGDFDDTLIWPIQYKMEIILLSQSSNAKPYCRSIAVSELYLEHFPQSFGKPTSLRNVAFGRYNFCDCEEIIEARYCENDSVTLVFEVQEY